MSIFFIDYVTTYRKYCKSGKGAILAELLPKFERMMMTKEVFNDFFNILQRKISFLNKSFPKSKPFCIDKIHGSLYIRPDGSIKAASFDSDYVAVIGVKMVKMCAATTDVQKIFDLSYDSMTEKGGNDE